jgi:hypothetical protein
VRILVANHPAAYRDALARTLAAVRPDAAIATAPASAVPFAALEAYDLVICSRATAALESAPCAWVELYPANTSPSRVSLGGVVRTLDDPTLDDLIAIVDVVAIDV